MFSEEIESGVVRTMAEMRRILAAAVFSRTAGAFPDQTADANFWVDVLFTTTP